MIISVFLLEGLFESTLLLVIVTDVQDSVD